MKKFFLFTVLFILSPVVCAENYVNGEFTVVTDFQPVFARLIIDNTKIFCEYNGQTRTNSPITIYFSKTGKETEKLLEQLGYKTNSDYGYFVPENSAIYAHLFSEDGRYCGWGPLFHQIAVKIVEENFSNCPPWFSEGLAAYLGEQRIVISNTQLTVPRPSPCRQQLLRDRMEKGQKPNLKRLFVLSKDERFNNWEVGTPFASALFYWLSDTGALEKYLQKVKDKGYKIEVLEDAVQKPDEKINHELIKYIKKNCYAGAYIKDGQDANNATVKEQAFLKALELRPGYSAALIELARIYNGQNNFEKCRDYLKEILSNPMSPDYRDARELIGDTYYHEKEYDKALSHYNEAWKFSEFYEYKYRIAYKIANCYNNQKDQPQATGWYKTFLQCDWDLEETENQITYAKKFTGAELMADAKTNTKSEKSELNSPSNQSPQAAKNPGQPPKVKLETTLGDIVIELDPNKAPVTTKNFLRYTNEKFYDGTIFHRVIRDFMIQGGGFTENMEQKNAHEPIVNESANGLRNLKGTIAMARTTAPDSATAQFFINHKDNDFLNGSKNKPGYAVFGKVIKGIEVVDAIAAQPTTKKGFNADVPVTAIVIKSATVVSD